MSKLFSNFQIKGLNFKNRIVMPPMCMYQANNDGHANNWHLVHYATRASGGVGSIIVEAVGVEKRGRISENDLGLWSDTHIPKLKEIVEHVHTYDTIIGVQLNHAGRKSQTKGEDIIAPSAISYDDRSTTPMEMNEDNINEVINLFKDAAKRALQVGFDFIEIHGAHGYLISEFLSPLSNMRNDQYGGSLEKRSLFLKKIITSIRSVWPKEKVLGLRVSAEDYYKEGLHPNDLADIINNLKDDGLDFIDVSSGGVVSAKVNPYPGYQLEFAKIIKEKTKLPVMGGGLIEDPKIAEFALNNGNADFVYVGRELLRNPYFCLNAAKALNHDLEWPLSYKRAKL